MNNKPSLNSILEKIKKSSDMKTTDDIATLINTYEDIQVNEYYKWQYYLYNILNTYLYKIENQSITYKYNKYKYKYFHINKNIYKNKYLFYKNIQIGGCDMKIIDDIIDNKYNFNDSLQCTDYDVIDYNDIDNNVNDNNSVKCINNKLPFNKHISDYDNTIR
jgi:hypothetical protein